MTYFVQVTASDPRLHGIVQGFCMIVPTRSDACESIIQAKRAMRLRLDTRFTVTLDMISDDGTATPVPLNPYEQP